MQSVCTCGLIHEAVILSELIQGFEKNVKSSDGMLNFLFLFSCVSPQGKSNFPFFIAASALRSWETKDFSQELGISVKLTGN